jgi:uncharacterized Zn-finger protein
MTEQKAFETIRVTHTEVACDGDAGPLGHPRVFLHIDRSIGQVTCPYCSRQYVYEHGAHHVA